MEATKRKLLINPVEKANWLSKLFLLWTFKVFKNGWQKDLEVDDLYETLQRDKTAQLGDRLDRNWKSQRKNVSSSGRPRLYKSILRTFWEDFVWLPVLTFVSFFGCRGFQPFLLGQLLKYFRKNSNTTYDEALLYATALVALNFLHITVVTWIFMKSKHLGMKMRISLCSLAYRKVLSLSHASLRRAEIGNLVNILSNDLNRCDYIGVGYSAILVTPGICGLLVFMLWREYKWPGIIGFSIIISFLLIQGLLSKIISMLRLKAAARTDKRIKLINEVINGIQVIKIRGWEQRFSQMAAIIRRMELTFIRYTLNMRGIFLTFKLIDTKLVVFCVMLSAALLYGSSEIRAEKVFVLAAYLNVVASTAIYYFAKGVTDISEFLVALKRLETILQLDELNRGAKELQFNFKSEYAVAIEDATSRWIPDNLQPTDQSSTEKFQIYTNLAVDEPTLQNISLNIQHGSLVAIVGPMNCGKSSLLLTIAGELPLESGSISVNGLVSIATQEPWVFAGSVRQNILFGEPMNRSRFNAVLRECDLVKDMEQLKNGEKTIIGERGASLSCGQKSRLSLARAMYRKASLYLFDDPLSAVDTPVSRHLFDNCIGRNSRLAKEGATRIIVTHHLHYLNEVDYIIVLCDGKIEMQGTPESILSDNLMPEAVARKIRQDNNRIKLYEKSEAFSYDHSIDFDANNDQELSTEDIRQLEVTSKGKVQESLSHTYISASGNFCWIFQVFLLFVLTQCLGSACDYWTSYWTSQEEKRAFKYHTLNATISSDEFLSTESCMSVHTIIMSMFCLIGVLRFYGFFRLSSNASQNLHNRMFDNTISTKMQFFDQTPSGQILNRFSKDMGVVDELLPPSFLFVIQMILSAIGSVIVTIFVCPIALAPVSLLAVGVVATTWVYLKTSTNLKRLEGMCRSPVYSHISATLDGLATIRTLHSQQKLIDEFNYHNDLHSASWYLFITTDTAFGLVLMMLCFLLIFSVIFYFVLVDDGNRASGNEVGLAITQVMLLINSIKFTVREIGAYINQLMSVERVLEYCNLPPEENLKSAKQLSKSWPLYGRIEYRNVNYLYSIPSNPVLKQLSFKINPMEKCGIVGRTGAGKSSLIGSLLRFGYIEGKILIDGLNTATLDLSEFRNKISVVPQSPVIFSGTLRENLDPFNEYSDDEIWSALNAVELKSMISEGIGLNQIVDGSSNEFSPGYRQLLCLAQAILRKNRILVLDEATANVDLRIDGIIKNTIQKHFEECTVLTVAHRLHTIIDSDRVIVMDNGQIVEFAEPYILLQDTAGIFRKMVYMLEPDEAKHLVNQAEDCYRRKGKK